MSNYIPLFVDVIDYLSMPWCRRRFSLMSVSKRDSRDTSIAFYALCHRRRVTHICVTEMGHHWFWKWLVTCSAPNHYPDQWVLIVNWTPREKFQRNLYQTSHSQKCILENVVCKMAAICLGVDVCRFWDSPLEQWTWEPATEWLTNWPGFMPFSTQKDTTTLSKLTAHKCVCCLLRVLITQEFAASANNSEFTGNHIDHLEDYHHRQRIWFIR